jgi:hypothetical protein
VLLVSEARINARFWANWPIRELRRCEQAVAINNIRSHCAQKEAVGTNIIME